jgi:hypothetical protein
MVSGDRSSSQVIFDLLSEAGIVAVLAFIRQSNVPAVDKRVLRDLVFTYVTSGGDQGLRVDLENRLRALAVSAPTMPSATPAAAVNTPPSTTEVLAKSVLPTAQVVAASKSTTGFGSGRQVPTFRQPTATTDVNPTVPSRVEVASANTRIVPVRSAALVPETTKPAAAIATDEVVPVDAAVTSTSPATAPVSTEQLPTPAVVVGSPSPELVVDTSVARGAAVNTADALIRISEIKNLINAKVGNPVNLVDLDNEIGRAYMTHLLDAMKIASGGEGDIMAAMARLETTVNSVLAVIKEKQVVAPITTEQTPQVIQPRVVPPATADVTPIDVVIPHKPSAAEPAKIPEKVEVAVPLRSVSNLPPLRTPADLPTAMDLKARQGVTDPLYDADVDTGLEQLLSEWSLFKKSGLFGTGPKGRQHPLFATLAPLSLGMIIAGRFDGVTPEIRQSISDYMNGWRYEQGITFENEETFEHYLRRVIRHIIDSQNRRRTA